MCQHFYSLGVEVCFTRIGKVLDREFVRVINIYTLTGNDYWGWCEY